MSLRGLAQLVFLPAKSSAAPLGYPQCSLLRGGRARRLVIGAWTTVGTAVTSTSMPAVAAMQPPLVASSTPDQPHLQPTAQSSAQTRGASEPQKPPTFAYLRRPLRPSARYLDHGVLEFFVAPGIPQIYRLGVAVGVLDHLTLGVATHWLPGQKIPIFVPHAALRIMQYSLFEFGLSYRGGLFAPPKIPAPDDPEAMVEGPADQLKPLFEKRAHFLLAGLGFVHQYVSAGAELGWVNRRVLLRNVPKPNAYRFERVWDGASAVYLRVGNRCAGVTLQAFYPSLDVELRLDLRWPAFALRERSCRQG